jgi:hypothetical protein
VYIYPHSLGAVTQLFAKWEGNVMISIGSCIVDVWSLDTQYTGKIATESKNMVWSHAIKKQENNKSYAIKWAISLMPQFTKHASQSTNTREQ